MHSIWIVWIKLQHTNWHTMPKEKIPWVMLIFISLKQPNRDQVRTRIELLFTWNVRDGQAVRSFLRNLICFIISNKTMLVTCQVEIPMFKFTMCDRLCSYVCSVHTKRALYSISDCYFVIKYFDVGIGKHMVRNRCCCCCCCCCSFWLFLQLMSVCVDFRATPISFAIMI